MIGSYVINTAWGDFRTYLPIGPDFSGVSLAGGISAAEAERRERARRQQERQQCFEKLVQWAHGACTLTPEVLEQLNSLAHSDDYYDWLAALHCYALPNSLFITIANKLSTIDNSLDIVQHVVDTMTQRVSFIRSMNAAQVKALKEGRNVVDGSTWFTTELRSYDLTPEEVTDNQQKLNELIDTLPEALAKSSFYYAKNAAASLTTSEELLTKLARKCAKITKNLAWRNKLAKTIMASSAFNENVTFELIQAKRQIKKYVWDDMTIACEVWLPVLYKHQISRATAEYVRKLVAEEQNSDAYQDGCGFWAFDNCKAFKEAIDRMERIVQPYL